MSASVLKCPQCAAPLAPPSRFARSVVCEFCKATVQIDPSVVSAQRFRDAYRDWTAPARIGHAKVVTIAGSDWAVGKLIAQGEIADVFWAERARWPTERVVLKALRASSDAARFEREWEALVALQSSSADGAARFTARLPQPVAHGVSSGGPFGGAQAIVLRRAPGFRHTFSDVKRAFPDGVAPEVVIWMWRRVLETLSFVHRSGWIHGAVEPAHLLVQEGEHGVLLVGYGHAKRSGDAALDLRMSAEAIAFVAGSRAPAGLLEPIRRVARDGAADAWQLHEEVGAIGESLFGPPAFHPLVWPT